MEVKAGGMPKAQLLLASGKPSADDQDKASHNSKHRDSQAPRDECTDTDKTGTDSHDGEKQPTADAKRLEDLTVEKFSLQKNFQERVAQQMDVMLEVFNTYGTLLSEAYRSEWTKIIKDLCHSDVYMSRQISQRKAHVD